MTADRTSHQLLSHFDRPKLIVLDDFEWTEDAAADERGIIVANTPADNRGLANAGTHLRDENDGQELTHPTRGPIWVLQWAAAIVVLAYAATLLIQFAYIVAAENALNVAARAAATEATLPRATYQTIWAAAERRLADYPELIHQLQFSLLENDAPVGERFRTVGGDRIAVKISAPTSAALPAWLRRISFSREQTPLSGRAERGVPGRKLRVAPS